MTHAHDLTGRRYGRLFVLGRSPSTNRHVRWACRCDCSALITANALSLNRGERKSCGCLRLDNPGAVVQHIQAMARWDRTYRAKQTELKWARKGAGALS